MAEVEITRKQIIVVGEVGQNSYGDLTWTDKEGKNYKVPTKRRAYFNDIIITGAAVQLNYAVYMKKEYIYSATLLKDKLPDKPPAQQVAQTAATKLQVTSPAKEESGSKPLTKDEQIERAVWIKELGECIRTGNIEATPRGQTLINAYYAEMVRVLGINIKEMQPAKSLIEEARRWGAKKVEEPDNIPF